MVERQRADRDLARPHSPRDIDPARGKPSLPDLGPEIFCPLAPPDDDQYRQ